MKLDTKGHFTHETESPWPLHVKHSHWWRRRSRSKFASHDAWEIDRVCEWQDGCKVYMDSYMASNGSWFMVTWTVFKNHLLEVGLTQNREIMALWKFATVDLLYFIMCEDPHEYKLIEIALVESLVTYDFTLHLRVCDHNTWFWRCLGMVFGHFFLNPHNFWLLAHVLKWP